MSVRLSITGIALIGALLATPVYADIVVQDDSGAEVRLKQPARRIVSLAPHLTELLFAAGAGAQVVGSVAYSDYPPAAQQIPRVGAYDRIDLETIAALHPDLVVAWQSGNLAGHLEQIRRLGIPLLLTEPKQIDDVARILVMLGRLAGTSAVADQAGAELRARTEKLRLRYSRQAPLRVFYQVWQQPLTTVNDGQIISDVIHLCGGINVFGALPGLAPVISTEAVLRADPDVIIASGMDAARPEWLDGWKQWPQLKAVARGNLFFIPPDLIQRHTPRLLDGATQLCTQLDQARKPGSPPVK